MVEHDADVGEQVLAVATDAAREILGARLDAVYSLGSLAHGGFAPLVSDIDIALVLTSLTPTISGQIADVHALTSRRSTTALAQRLSIFWSGWDGVRHGAGVHAQLPAVDRLDLIDDGRLLWGTDRRCPCVRPDAATLVREGADFACARFDEDYLAQLHHPATLLGAGVRAVTKTVLFPVRLLYTLRTQRIGLNAAATGWYAQHGNHHPLPTEAMRWRVEGITDTTTAAALLETHIVGLYLEFFDAYHRTLTQVGQHTRATALRQRRDTLHQATNTAAPRDESVSIRSGRPVDAPALAELARDAYAHYVQRIGIEPAPMYADYPKLIKAGQVWIAEQDEQMVGLLVLIPAADHLLLDNVAVAPRAQGTGIGAQLLEFTEQRTRAHGLTQVRLYTNEAMTENIDYYTRRGYHETHRGTERGYRRVHFTKHL